MVLVGAVVAGLSGSLWAWRYAILLGWDAAAVTFSAWIWVVITPMDPTRTASHAGREDPARTNTDVLVLTACIASLVAVGVVLVDANSAHGTTRGLLAGLAVLSVSLSWLLVHTLFTLRYAMLYYSGSPGGIDFNQEEAPRYTDFAYLAFTLGMTFQVSDTNLTRHRIRATALRHALLSYLFGSVILATSVNLVVSLASTGGRAGG